jgi:hypothetical protein
MMGARNKISVNETLEIMSDPKIMASLAKSIADEEKGKIFDISEV